MACFLSDLPKLRQKTPMCLLIQLRGVEMNYSFCVNFPLPCTKVNRITVSCNQETNYFGTLHPTILNKLCCLCPPLKLPADFEMNVMISIFDALIDGL